MKLTLFKNKRNQPQLFIFNNKYKWIVIHIENTLKITKSFSKIYKYF